MSRLPRSRSATLTGAAALAGLLATGCWTDSRPPVDPWPEPPPGPPIGEPEPLPPSTGLFLDPRVAGAPVTSPVTPPPISGGTLLVSADGARAYVADPDRDRVVTVDLATDRVSALRPLPPGAEPGRLVEDATGRVHVALRGAGALYTFVPGSSDSGVTRDVCPMPRGVAYDAARDAVLVACRGGELVTLPAAGGAPIARVTVEGDLRDVLVAEGRTFVTTFRTAELLELDADGAVRARRRPTSSVGLGGMVAFDAAETDAPRFPVFEPAVAWRAVYSSSLRAVVMVHQRASDAEVEPQPGGYGSGGGCGESGIVQSAVTLFPMDGGVRASVELGATTLPVDLALFEGSELAVPAAGNQSRMRSVTLISSLDTNLDAERSGPCAPVGEYVMTDGLGPAGPTSVAYDPRGALLVLERDPAALVHRGRRIPLGGEARFDTGHALFHSNANAFVACASCHPEGGEDGRVWHFRGIGPRRTPAMHGDLRATAPFHWDGDMTDLGTLMHEVFTARMGGPEMSAPQVDALGEWLDVLPRPALSPQPADAVARGRAIYEGSAGCVSCHGGANLTNNTSVNVGTGGVFQVPSLVGVSARLPVMHTGCATTLRARFEPACGGGEAHGHTADLSPAELDDLVTYLETL